MAAPTPNRLTKFFQWVSQLAEHGHITDAWLDEFYSPSGRWQLIDRSLEVLAEFIRNTAWSTGKEAASEALALLLEETARLQRLTTPGGTKPLSPKQRENLWRSVDELELSVRAANALHNRNIRRMWELTKLTQAEVLYTKNVGRKTLNVLRGCLAQYGLWLGMQLPTVPPPKPPE